MGTEVDMINHPPHYSNRQHECIDEMVAVFGVDAVIAHCKCNAWKYRYRANSKGDYEENMEKSDWYINKMIELQGEKRHNSAVTVKCENNPKSIHALNRDIDNGLKTYANRGRHTYDIERIPGTCSEDDQSEPE